MSVLSRLFAPTAVAHAHCDLPCGVYDPEQARIEAESCYRIIEKYAANEDAAFRTRAIASRRSEAELVKHHLDVLWHDYFKPEHLEEVPNLHDLFWNATKQVSKVKASTDLGRREEAARPDRRDRRGLEGDRRRGQDAGRRPPQLTASGRSDPRASSGDGASPTSGGSSGPPALAERSRGPWRVAVVRGSRWSRRSRRATGCWSIRRSTRWPRRGRDRGVPRARRRACSRSSGWRAGRASVPVRATASCSSATTRRGWWATRPTRRRPAAGHGVPSTRVATGR